MSLSLLNNYDSSDDDDDSEQGDEGKLTAKDDEIEKSNDRIEGKNFLIADSDDDETEEQDAEISDEDDRNGGGSMKNNLSSTTTTPLPRPFSNTIETDRSSVSVFRNPYLEAERAETRLLEQHVKMSETAFNNNDHHRAKREVRRSKQLCRQFKRGRCRLGDKCRFSHTIITTTEGQESATAAAVASSSTMEEPAATSTTVYDGRAIKYTEWGREEIVGDHDEDDGDQKKSKKRRVGVTNSLLPPKRAMANYEKQRRDESPWMNS